ncbi:MAG: hypothetical protein ACYDD4_02095 [Acidimicrobiales bacterium]
MVSTVYGSLSTISAPKPSGDSIDHAVTSLRHALAPQLWPASPANLVAPNAAPFFDNLQQAVNSLEQLRTPPASWGIAANISTLVSAARTAAVNAIAANLCGARHQQNVQQAEQQLAQGDGHMVKGPADSAIPQYKSAWQTAIGAQGTACAS